MTAKVRCEFISWSRFYNLSRTLCRRIFASGYRPDCIIAIGRGGYMPARIISDFLDIMNLTSFKIEHYHGTRKKPVAVIRYPLSKKIEGTKVLLVDDVCDTGVTFDVARKHLEECMQSQEVRTAVMHYKQVSTFVPDYYAQRMLKWRWIIYPWAAAEDISEFIKEMRPRPENCEQISKKLARDYGVRIPRQTLEDIMAMSK